MNPNLTTELIENDVKYLIDNGGSPGQIRANKNTIEAISFLYRVRIDFLKTQNITAIIIPGCPKPLQLIIDESIQNDVYYVI